ncbi:MAG: acetate--CoA ligase family protein [Candidatus Bathyarchaeia archaeon]
MGKSEFKDPLDNFFSPRSIAIVGASSKPGKIGHEIVRNISQHDYKGRVYPVNPAAESILGLKCYRNIGEVDGDVDLAVFVAASNILPGLIEEACERGVRNAIIVSGGFKEMGGEGAKYEEQIVSTARKYGMRVIGPNCIGVFDSTTRLDTFFYPHDRMVRPPPGGVSFITQSGTFGLTFLEWATNSRMGMRRLVSLGNRCDVNELDMLRYLGRDPLTKVIALHLESLTDGRQLVKEAREASSRKPIIILKTGRVEESKAAMSHTGAVTGSYQVCRSVLKDSGMIIADSFEELFDMSKALEKQPTAKGNNITIVTNAAGPSVAAADLCHEYGLNMVKYSEGTLKRLCSTLPPYAVIGEYVDLTGSATCEDYKRTFEIILEEPNIDAILCFVVFLNPPITPEVVEVISEVQKCKRPIICWATGGDYSQRLIARLEDANVPVYPTSERAVKSVRALIEAGVAKGWSEPEPIQADRGAAGGIIKRVAAEGRDVLTELESKNVLRAYGVETTVEYVAKSPIEAGNLAFKIGFPVVMKILSPDITHKSDVGGVVTDIENPQEATRAFEEIMRNVRERQPKARLEGVVVENQLPRGIEVLVGSTVDRDFGPVVAFGLGGVFVEAFKDISYGLAPLSENDALRVISRTNVARLLAGFRGFEPADIDKLLNLLRRVSYLAYEQPIVEMDLNPVIVTSKECTVADARIRVAAPNN